MIISKALKYINDKINASNEYSEINKVAIHIPMTSSMTIQGGSSTAYFFSTLVITNQLPHVSGINIGKYKKKGGLNCPRMIRGIKIARLPAVPGAFGDSPLPQNVTKNMSRFFSGGLVVLSLIKR